MLMVSPLPRSPLHITKWALFTSLGPFFSNSNSCIGGFGPLETLGDPFPRGPPRPSPPPPTSGIISPALPLRRHRGCHSRRSDRTKDTLRRASVYEPEDCGERRNAWELTAEALPRGRSAARVKRSGRWVVSNAALAARSAVC